MAVHTVELLEHALEAARQLGMKVRPEWLSGAGGGGCEIKGQKWIFLDLGQSPLEQLDQVVQALRGEPALARLDLPPELKAMLHVRKTA